MYSEYACLHQLVKKAVVNLPIIYILFQLTLRSGERQKKIIAILPTHLR